MIWIDRRQGSAQFARAAPLADLAEVTTLDSADVMFIGNGPDNKVAVGVEVKSVWDFLSSSATGRLQATQIPAMLDYYDFSWILIHGEYHVHPRSGNLIYQRGRKWYSYSVHGKPVPYSFIERLIFSITASGIHVGKAVDERAAALWIRALYDWFQKEWGQHKAMRKFDKSHRIPTQLEVDPETMLRAKLASCLPGIGFDKAISVARFFDTIEAMWEARIDEWEQVPGIGKVLAESAWVALHTNGRK